MKEIERLTSNPEYNSGMQSLFLILHEHYSMVELLDRQSLCAVKTLLGVDR